MIGTRLAHYEITSHLGSGGMGEVYEATDTKLGRSVAIKFLPEAFSHDTERVARFQREARVLASLNHPNIAAIHGLEEMNGRHFLVMELVSGETLADRIKRGSIPIEEALSIAKQIAEALEEAHEKGIIHRDLKPANIKVTPEGKVKVLDFGLAKAYEREQLDAVLSNSPTMMSMGATGAGVILGTAAYMSPEQAKGRPVDKRADIWAFGVVLYEMATGKRLFGGEDLTDILASVVKVEPDLNAAPPQLQRLLKKCLEKDPRKRLRDIGDVWELLEERRAGSSPPVGNLRHSRWSWPALVVLAVVATVLAFLALRPGREPQVSRLSIPLPPGQEVRGRPAISDDGRVIAYAARQGAEDSLLYLRNLNSFKSRLVPGSRDGEQPFFSPNGDRVAFFAQGGLYRAEVSGGMPSRIAEVPLPVGGTWTNNDTIIYSGYPNGLVQIPANGGSQDTLTRPDEDSPGETHVFPQMLPDGEHVLFTVWGEAPGAAVLSLETRQWKKISGDEVSRSEGSLTIVPSSGSFPYLLSTSQPGEVRAALFDPSNAAETANGTTVLEDVFVQIGLYLSSLAVSRTGTAVYAAGNATRTSLAWVNRSGAVQPLDSGQALYQSVAIAPDGRRAVVGIDDELWVHDFERGPSRLTNKSGSGSSITPLLDGPQVIYSRGNGGGDWDLEVQTLDRNSKPETLLERPGGQFATSMTPDGTIIFTDIDSDTGADIWTRSPDGQLAELLRTPYNEGGAVVSPDGRWLAYTSDESGRREVYIRSYPSGAITGKVSDGGGAYPKWAPDGRELFYADGDAIRAVTVRPDGSLGKPERLFEHSIEFRGPYFDLHPYDVAPDGRFLMIRRDEGSVPNQLNVIQNWTADLDRLVGGQ